MARASVSNKSGVAALATALALLVLPGMAHAQFRDRERQDILQGQGGRDAQTRGQPQDGGQDHRSRDNGANAPQRSAPVVQAPAHAPSSVPVQIPQSPRAGNGWPVGGGAAPVTRAPEPQRPQVQRDEPQRNWQGAERGRPAPQQAEPQRQGREWQGRDWQGGEHQRDERRDRQNDGNWGNDRGRQQTPQANNRAWSREWQRDNRYDWRGWRETHRQDFRVGRYSAPYRGYSYRRLSLGFFLEPLFFSQNYVIFDPWAYRLPPAYGPYRWVRYYDDAVLVDIYTGRVADVIYDFFW